MEVRFSPVSRVLAACCLLANLLGPPWTLKRVVTVETYVKTNIFNIWSNECFHPKLTLFGGVEGFRREKLYLHGVPYGVGCHSPGRWGGLTGFLGKNFKLVLGFNFFFYFFI